MPGVARAVGDVAFPAGAWSDGGRKLEAEDADRIVGHGWASAALTPYRLSTGREPRRPAEVVADARLGARPGDVIRVVTPPATRATASAGSPTREVPATRARPRCSSAMRTPDGWPERRAA